MLRNVRIDGKVLLQNTFGEGSPRIRPPMTGVGLLVENSAQGAAPGRSGIRVRRSKDAVAATAGRVAMRVVSSDGLLVIGPRLLADNRTPDAIALELDANSDNNVFGAWRSRAICGTMVRETAPSESSTSAMERPHCLRAISRPAVGRVTRRPA